MSLDDDLYAHLSTWLDKIEQRARRGLSVADQEIRFRVCRDADKDDDGAPYLRVVVTETEDTDVEGRLDMLPKVVGHGG